VFTAQRERVRALEAQVRKLQGRVEKAAAGPEADQVRAVIVSFNCVGAMEKAS
jgi:hypothetical protein